jgi:hypothetical protein
MSRTLNFTAVSVALFALTTFSTVESTSQAFARGNASHGRSSRSVGRPHMAERVVQRRAPRVVRGRNFGSRSYCFGDAGYGSYQTDAVPTQTCDCHACPVGDDTSVDDADDTSDAVSDGAADSRTVTVTSPTYFAGSNGHPDLFVHHNPVVHRLSNHRGHAGSGNHVVHVGHGGGRRR